MKCLICITPDDARPGNGTGEFDALFGELVRSKPGYSWLIDGDGYDPWRWPPDWYGDDDKLSVIDAQLELHETSEYGVIGTTAFMDKYMRYLSCFWIDIYGFPQPPTDVKNVSCWKADCLPALVKFPQEATHALINIDGSFWAVLSDHEADLVNIVKSWPNSQYVEHELISMSK